MRHLPYDRAQRVANEVLHIVATLCRNEISDPRLKGVEITYVKMTKDLQIARIYYYSEGADDKRRREIEKGLESASGFFKRAIGEELKLRVMPAVEYFYDETIDLEEKMNRLVSKK